MRHSRRLPALAAAALAVAAAAAAGGLEPGEEPGTPADLACSVEAVDLTAPVEVRAAPDEGAPIIERLDAGRSIYLCREGGRFRAIRYPAAEEPVDCSRTDRERPCAVGWVAVPPRYEIRG